jgi:hypothetical protein
MNAFFRTTLYTKNITSAERVLRITAAAAGVSVALLQLAEPWQQWVAALGAIGFALTGAVGFCPACYLAGRKLADRTAP